MFIVIFFFEYRFRLDYEVEGVGELVVIVLGV